MNSDIRLRSKYKSYQKILPSNGNVDEILSKIHPIKGELGFLNWLGVIFFVVVIYGAVVWQDRRMPPVLSADQYDNFSEERAKIVLNQITSLGPRPSGSKACEVDAFNIIVNKVTNLKNIFDSKQVNRLELDVQRPSGCFNLKFLSPFTLCYHKVTNIAVRIGPRTQPASHSILLNCHFDTLPDTPGATDDAVSCAIMLEILEVISHSTEKLPNDIIFLFNGAEENFMQASHGWITQHPWRHSLRAFINLEGTGSGGREILFQAGPGDSWLLKTYLDKAPHPHCSVIAQEVFQSGIIPSDTDFRVFRDYGRVSGLDIAYYRNGWVYHTEFDVPQSISTGSVQRSGENVLALTKALISSPYLKQPANFQEGNRWVFYDVIGLFTIFYEVEQGAMINYLTAISVFLLVFYRIRSRVYTTTDLLRAFGHHAIAFVLMFLTGVVLLGFTQLLNLNPIIFTLGKIGAIRVVTPKTILVAQAFCMLPAIVFTSCAIMLFFDFFVPVMGRLGNVINPEFIIMPLSFLSAYIFVMFTNNLIYVSRRLHFFVKCSFALSLFAMVIIATTRVGDPYKYSETSPRLRRIIALHSKRTIYDFNGKLNSTDTGLFVSALDYRGITDLPDHTFLQGTGKPDCSHTHDEYCQLPYYTAIHQLFPPEETRWVPLPSVPHIPRPISVEMIGHEQPAGNQVKISLVIRGGADKMSLHVTPLNGYSLKEWSFTPIETEVLGMKTTYFVFLTYGHEPPVDRTLWILLENNNPAPMDPKTTPSMEFAVATHYAHGNDQNSETLFQLRELIKTRRKTPHYAVGYWKWGITMIGGVSEIIVHKF
ncbi:peptidase family m28 domain-containing protein [Ditylenchus destructor]|uniref:FXNA-like protease n=1 Tax=Ditylenchus destructor TaxID=166010 RepID=A0AAD4NCR7_9BILA|nr:peptidase family m28 domain-containing protein [Ditylenchus destructor]